MSTCARCGGALTAHHVCHGTLTMVAWWVVDVVFGGLVGAVVGLLVLSQMLTAITGEPFHLVGLAAGPVAGIALARTLRKMTHASGRGFHV